MSFRLAHVTTVHSLNDGRIARKECRAAADAGFDVHLLGLTRPDESVSIPAGVKVHFAHRPNGRVGRAFVGSLRLFRKLRALNPDVIHVHDPELLPLLVAWKAWRRQTIAVYDAHEDLVSQLDGKSYLPQVALPVLRVLTRRFLHLGLTQIDGVVCATPHIEQTVSPRNSVVVQNFPWRVDEFNNPRENADPRVAYIGGLSLGRGLGEMIAATRIVRDSGIPLTLVLAGPVDEQGKALIEANLEYVDYLGVIDPSAVPAVLSGCVAGLAVLRPLPNYLESHPTKVFEYMAAGIPFIASNFPHWQKLFGRFEAGFFVDNDSPAEIADVIRRLCGDPALCLLTGHRGRLAYEAEFVFDEEGKKLVEFYAELLGLNR